MIASSGIAESDDVVEALHRAFGSALALMPDAIDGAIVFVSGNHLFEHAKEIQTEIQEHVPSTPVFGCSAESLLGVKCEIERRTAASVLLLSNLPAPMQVFPMECLRTPDGLSIIGISEEISEAHRCGGLVVVACPLTFSIERLAEALEPPRGERVVPILGGYCSSGQWEEPNLLICNDRILDHGAVGLIMPSELSWKTIVSQGCRPIGDPMIITGLDETRILALGGKPALQMLRAVLQQLPNHDRELAIESLLIGRAITEYSDTFSHGDFLIRNVHRIEPDTQSIVVTDRFQVGQTIRFHVRDAETADADLCQLLSLQKSIQPKAKAGLLFSCNGRGQRMFREANHDASKVDKYFPSLPLSGFFAAGEFAPVGNLNLVHGFTAVTALLCERESSTND